MGMTIVQIAIYFLVFYYAAYNHITIYMDLFCVRKNGLISKLVLKLSGLKAL